MQSRLCWLCPKQPTPRQFFGERPGTDLNNMTTSRMIADAIIAIDENAYYCGDYEIVDGNYKMDITVDHDLNVIFNRIEKRKSGIFTGAVLKIQKRRKRNSSRNSFRV